MKDAPYGFVNSIDLYETDYTKFDGFEKKNGNVQHGTMLMNLTVDLDNKKFLLETSCPGEETSCLHQVELVDLEKHWPIGVGLCGHFNTQIVMVCPFFFFLFLVLKIEKGGVKN